MRTVISGRDDVEIAVSSPTPGVAIVDAIIGAERDAAPLHWRVGDWSKPPLDVRLGMDGRIQSVQVILQDEEVDVDPSMTVPADAWFAGTGGFALIDLRDWPGNRYLDEQVAVRTARSSSGELVVCIGDEAAGQWILYGQNLKVGLAPTDELVTLAIGPLSADQWHLVAAARPSRA